MAIKKYVAISYCFAFMFVYLASIAYALVSSSVNKIYDNALPQTIAMNSTSSAISSLSGGSSSILIVIIVFVLALTIIFLLNSVRAMGNAI